MLMLSVIPFKSDVYFYHQHSIVYFSREAYAPTTKLGVVVEIEAGSLQFLITNLMKRLSLSEVLPLLVRPLHQNHHSSTLI